MKKWICCLVLASSIFATVARSQSKPEIVGTWELVSSTDTTEKGEVADSFGKSPTGFLTYTADGRMMAIISFGDRKLLSVPDYIAAPAEERAAAFATFAAYAGTYTLEPGRIVHHVQVAWLQNMVGTDQVRTIVKLARDTLILRTPPIRKGGKMVVQQLIWQRVKGGSKEN